MFCQQCGTAISEGSSSCGSCGQPVTKAGTSADVAQRVKVASADAWMAFRTFGANPVGGLAPAFESVSPSRALGAGIAFAVFYDLATLLGAYLLVKRATMGLPFNINSSEVTFGQILKLLVIGAVPLAGFTSAAMLARSLFKGTGSFEGDVFISGAALVPTGLFWIVAGMLGVGNAEVILVLAAFAVCYTILILFTGLTRVSKISEAAAAPAVCISLLLTAWIAKIIVAALFV